MLSARTLLRAIEGWRAFCIRHPETVSDDPLKDAEGES
jgi:hypothetical protein